MGKLGGRELNYGSDLDVVFAYSDEVSRGLGGAAVFTRLAEEFIRVLGEPSAKGVGYGVDARLRPMGREAPLVHSVEAYRAYFADQAESWERLAYTRSAFLAGDREVGARWSALLEGFVYGRGLRRRELDEILEVRGLMERKADRAAGPELKVSPGGLADVEFLAQTLQLSHGKDRPALRVPHLPTLLGRLAEEGVLPGPVAEALREDYGFLRRVEARHRMVRERSSDELPADPDRLDRLAWRLGEGRRVLGGKALVERIAATQGRIRATFRRLEGWLRLED
jgi:glutamate-ammonia-ligase adenylyltransferase